MTTNSRDALTGSVNTRLRLRVPYAGHPPSVNKTSRSNGLANHELLAPWTDNTITVARPVAKTLPVPLPQSLVRVTFPVPNRIRRDPHNYIGTVVKACIDGLVRAGWFDDDTAKDLFVCDPRLVVIEDLNDPRVTARANALIDVVPLANLRAALVGHPLLLDLFSTDT